MESFEDGYDWELDGLSTVAPRYSYRYHGKRYAGTRVDFTAGPWSASDFEQQGPRRHVFVNPNDPEQSVLQRELPRSLHQAALVGPIALLAGIWHLGFSLRSRWASRGRRARTKAEPAG